MGRMGLAVLLVALVAADAPTTAGRAAGVEMWVEIDGRDKPRALRIARSMRLVAD